MASLVRFFVYMLLIAISTQLASAVVHSEGIESLIDDHPTVRYILQEVQDLRSLIEDLGEKLAAQEGGKVNPLSEGATNSSTGNPSASVGNVPKQVIDALEKRITDKLKKVIDAQGKSIRAEIKHFQDKMSAQVNQTNPATNLRRNPEAATYGSKPDDGDDDFERYQKISNDIFGRVKEEFESFEKTVNQTIDKKMKAVQGRLTSPTARTCQELMDSHPTLDDGFYYIDPDGFNVGDPPLRVRCEKPGNTIMMHDTVKKLSVKKCPEAGCYSRNVTYTNATMRQIEALILLSANCSQHFHYECITAPLRFSGVDYAWWNDRNGKPQYYWTGNSTDNAHTCSCGLEGSCIDKNLKCNCDASLGSAFFDDGIITNKDHLPVTRLNFGRLLSSSSKGEHMLGPLRCSGARHVRNEKPTSCADLWQSGRLTHTGLYHVQDESGLVLMLHCDMSKMPGDTGFETLIGVLYQHIKPSFVVDNKAIVINLSVYKGRRFAVGTTRDHILAFQPVDSESLDAALKFIKIFDPEDGTHLTYGNENIYTKSNRAVIELSTDIPDGISIKISKAVECPFHLGDYTECGRVVDAGSCYCAVFQPRTWQEQTTFCKTNGFSLLALESAQEEQAIIAAWPDRDFWTSLNDRYKEGTWVWDATGATLTSSHYTNWREGQPDDRDGSRDCVDFFGGGWYDDYCSANYGAICEKHPKYW